MTRRPGRLLVTLAIAGAAAILPGAATADPPEKDALHVGRVIVLRKEVFNPSVPGYDRFPFTWLNALHYRTREQVIREAILFHEGDPYDAELLEETERNLRGLTFINYASVVPGERRGNEQDVVVETHDIWSTQLSILVDKANQGGEKGDEYEVRLEEQNVLGRGKRIELTYSRTGNVDGFGWLYADPLLLGSHWTTRAYRKDRDVGKEWGVDLRRPFYSLDTRFGGGGTFVYDSGDDRVFRDDREVGRFLREFQWGGAWFGRMMGGRYRKLMVDAELVREKSDFSNLRFAEGATPDSSILPPNEDRKHAALGVRAGIFRFVKERQLDYFEQVEDIELGGYGAVAFGPLWGGDARWRLTTETSVGLPAGRRRYAFLFARLTSDRHEADWRRTLLLSEAKYYARWSDWNTLATRVLWEEAWKVDPGREYFVDDANGLRGYDGTSDIGQRRFLLNVENRFFTPVRFFTVALGAAVFADIGAAWERDQPVRASDLRSTVGGGLRLGLTKVREAKALRIDVARDLTHGSFRFEIDLGHLFLVGRPFGDFVRSVEP